MVERFGFNLIVIDVGWLIIVLVIWVLLVVLILILVCLLVNLLLLYFNKIKILNVDIWNYWYFIVVGVVGYIVIGSYVWVIFCVILMELLVLFIVEKIVKNV